jgi:hypothetical protein
MIQSQQAAPQTSRLAEEIANRNCREPESKISLQEGACVEDARGYVHMNIPRYYVETLVKVSAKGVPVAEIVPLVFGQRRESRGCL